MLNWLLRYQPVISILKNHRPSSVLDVGSGRYGLSWYWPGRVVQTDLEFNGSEPVGRQGSAAFVAASADRLPFVDDAFDCTVCVDMMEHLPSGIRETVVGELSRVTRSVLLVAYPTGSTAQRCDAFLNKVLSKRPGGIPPWLREHLAQAEYPDRSTLEQALPPTWSIEHERPLGNAALQTLVVLAEGLPVVARGTVALERWVFRRGAVPKFFDRRPAYRTLFIAKPHSTASGVSTATAIEGSKAIKSGEQSAFSVGG